MKYDKNNRAFRKELYARAARVFENAEHGTVALFEGKPCYGICTAIALVAREIASKGGQLKTGCHVRSASLKGKEFPELMRLRPKHYEDTRPYWFPDETHFHAERAALLRMAESHAGRPNAIERLRASIRKKIVAACERAAALKLKILFWITFKKERKRHDGRCVTCAANETCMNMPKPRCWCDDDQQYALRIEGMAKRFIARK